MPIQLPEEAVASLLLDRANFCAATLESLELPAEFSHVEAADGSRVPYIILGNPTDAKSLVYTSTPYSTRLSDLSQQVRLKAQQEVLGENYCLIAAQLYEPKAQEFDRTEKAKIAEGSFVPLSDRLFAVMEKVPPRDDQEVVLYGFSMSADVMVETAYQSVRDPQRGLYEINKLGVFECARAAKRGRLAVIKAFADSGKDLYDNVMSYPSSALLEARDIDVLDPKAKKRHDNAMAKGVANYFRKDLSGNLALISGFSKPTSKKQLIELSESLDQPLIKVGRMQDSTVCPRSFFEGLLRSNSFVLMDLPGDHSNADSLARSASFILRTVS